MPAPVRFGAFNNGPHRLSRHASHKRNLADVAARCEHRHDCDVAICLSGPRLLRYPGEGCVGVVIGDVWHAPNITVSGWLAAGRRRGTHPAAGQTA